MRKVILILSALALAACEEGGGTSTGQLSDVTPIAPVTAPIQTNEPEKILETVEFFEHTQTVTPFSLWYGKTYTATGSCANFNDKTFCWSDGLKTLQWTYQNIVQGPYYFNYFLIHVDKTTPGPCNGGCKNDGMLSPRKITASLLLNLDQARVQKVFDFGVRKFMQCEVQETRAICGSLVFEGI